MSGWIQGKTKKDKEYYTKEDLDWIIMVVKPKHEEDFFILQTPTKELDDE